MSKTVLLATEKPFSASARDQVVAIIKEAGYTATVLESYKGKGPLIEEGMVFCVEPMVCAGGHAVRMGDDNWAIYSQDGSLTAHFEHTIAVTADGARILTPWHLKEDRAAA